MTLKYKYIVTKQYSLKNVIEIKYTSIIY